MKPTHIFVLAAASIASASAHAQAPGPGPWPWHDGWMWWWMPFHGLMWLVVIGLLVAVAIALIRWLTHGTDRSGASQQRAAALNILDARYARGEVDREEYLQRRKDLLEGR